MDTEELRPQIQALRAAGRTPKQIARALGTTPAAIAPIIRSIAAGQAGRQSDTGESPLVGCWISPGWSSGLILRDAPADWGDDSDHPGEGLVSVAVAREHRHGKVSFCGYLVDTYCLGVKNAVPPKVMDLLKVKAFLLDYFRAYDGEYLTAPISLAQHVVFGAAEYAKGLGFDPHPDFTLASGHLGRWTPPSRIGFGLNGKPFFQQGPYDNATQIMRTLDRSVGRGNYEFTIVSTGRPQR